MALNVSDDVQTILRATSDVAISSFVDRVSSGVFFVDVSSQDSSSISGFAEAFDEGLALHKAYSEYVERRVFAEHAARLGLKTTSGMAAHPDQAQALENASLELIEHDAFLVCWLGKRPPMWLSDEDVAALAGRSEVCLEGIRKHRMQPRIGIVALTGDVFTVCGALMGAEFASPFGFVVVTTAERKLSSCVEKTILTLLRCANTFVTRVDLGLALVCADPAQNRDFVDLHFNESLDLASFPRRSWFFESSAEILVLSTFDVSCEELTVKFPLGFPRCVALANAPGAQPFYFGETTTDVVNGERIRSIFGDDLVINHDSHPLL